jgi:hypothetical protein
MCQYTLRLKKHKLSIKEDLRSYIDIDDNERKRKIKGEIECKSLTCKGSKQKEKEASKLSHMQRLFVEKLLNIVN